MKDNMINEKLNEKMTEENLEEVSGGLNAMNLKVGGYADRAVVRNTIMNADTESKNVHPVINGNDRPKATHPFKTDMFGKPVLVDINDVDKGSNSTLV